MARKTHARDRSAEVGLWSSYPFPVGLQVDILLALEPDVDANSMLSNVRSGGEDDDIEGMLSSVGCHESGSVGVGDAGGDELDVGTMECLEPAVVERRSLAAES